MTGRAGGINAIAGAAVLVVGNTRFAWVRFTKIENYHCGIGCMVFGALAPARRAWAPGNLSATFKSEITERNEDDTTSGVNCAGPFFSH